MTEAIGPRDATWLERVLGPPVKVNPESMPIDEVAVPNVFALLETERQASFFMTGGLVAVHATGRDRKPLSVGFWFSLGHSTIVFCLSFLLAVGVKALAGPVEDGSSTLHSVTGVIGASVLRPTIPGTTIVGPALTLRNILQRIDALAGARDHVNKMAEFEAHNLATPGDVLVIYSDGVSEAVSPTGEEFGPTRLYEAVARNLDASAAGIRDRIERIECA